MNQLKVRTATVLLFLIFSIYFVDTGSNNRKLFGRNVMAFNSIRCIDHDKSFSHFAYCHLKPVNRTLKLLSLRVQLFKPPVTQSDVNFVLFKKANGYKPFIFNITLDICNYFRGNGKLSINWLFKALYPSTNINHSCPYTEDMIVDRFPLSLFQFPTPLPEGQYRIDVNVYAFKLLRATFSAFMSVTEE